MSSREERAAALAAGASAFGRWLLQERELRALGRDDVARLTKLAPALVEALESGDPERMPPKAYVFGYLRSYAAAVGLDPDDVVLRWQEVVGPEEARPAPRRRLGPRAAVAALVGLALLALAALTLLGPSEPRHLARPAATARPAAEP